MDKEWYCEWNPGITDLWIRPNDGSGPFTLTEAIETLRQWPESLTVGSRKGDRMMCRVMHDRTRQVIVLPSGG